MRAAEAGNFSAAARESNSTQCVVSKRVAALERLFGARLATCSTRALALTQDGERCFEIAQKPEDLVAHNCIFHTELATHSARK